MIIPGADFSEKLIWIVILYFVVRGALSLTGNIKQDFLDTINGLIFAGSQRKLAAGFMIATFWLYGFAMGL